MAGLRTLTRLPGLQPRFSPPFAVDGQQLFTHRVQDEFTGSDATGFAIVFNAFIERFGDICANAVITGGFSFFTHWMAFSWLADSADVMIVACIFQYRISVAGSSSSKVDDGVKK